MSDDYEVFLNFWFLDFRQNLNTQAIMQRWFAMNPDFDQALQTQFGDLLQQAEQEKLAHWQETPRSLLALIILLDQLSRNLYRGSAKAFANDAQALSLAKKMHDKNWVQQLLPLERLFVYLPFEHSESLEDQVFCLQAFEQLQTQVPAADQKLFALFTEYADKHYQVVKRFGRFPHRNNRLNRISSPEELAFLEEPGAHFG